MSWSTADIPDLDARIAVVTGANGGLGLSSAKALAGAGAHVVMAVRDAAKAKVAHDEILEAQSSASLEIVPLDLGSLASIEDAATEITGRHPAIDILLNNAGVMALPKRATTDGFEMQLGVNHFGHWVLTARLLPSLLAAEAARVVTVTSTAHHFGRAVNPDDVNLDRRYNAWLAYCRSKLANYHFALGLQQEFERRGAAAQSLVAHPGLTHSNLQVHTVDEGGGGWSAGMWKWMAANLGMDVDRGALSQLRAATDPEAKGGQMYAPRYINAGVPVRRPIMRPGRRKAIEILWEVSERETGAAF